jgi:hypothetical protein
VSQKDSFHPPAFHPELGTPPSTYWRLATLPQQRQLRFRGTDARHDAIELEQSYSFISGSGFLHADLRMVLSPALSRAKPIFDMNSRLMKAMQRMFERCSIEHGPHPNPSNALTRQSAAFSRPRVLDLVFSAWCGGADTALNEP